MKKNRLNLIITFFRNNSIIQNILFVVIYIAFYDYIWKNYCVPIWGYFRYFNIEHTWLYNTIGYSFAILPILFYKGIKKLSSWISILIYYFGYIPIILGILYSFKDNNEYPVILYWIVLAAAMSLFFIADRINIKIFNLSKRKISIKVIWIFAIFTTIYLLYIYIDNMRIANFEDIYDLREENSKIGGNILTQYISSWASTFTYSFVLCYGLIKNKKIIILLGILGFIFMYSIYGLKGTLFSPIVVYGLYKILIWNEKYNINILALISTGIALISIFLLNSLDTSIGASLSAVFFMRTLTISGLLFPEYYMTFFSNHNFTYFSHVNIINAFTNSYPYGEQPLGKVVAYGDMNANSIFWSMDGVASCGLTGVAIISIIIFLFLIFINGLVNKQNRMMVYMLFILPVMALLNVSFFTFLLSEGPLLIILTIIFVNIPVIDNKFNK